MSPKLSRYAIIVRAVIAVSIILFGSALWFRVLAERTDVYPLAMRYTAVYWALLGVTGLILAGLFLYQYRHLHREDDIEIDA
ncbi:MAG: hypothetical protein ABIF71_01850 [Planctomycetota bacterium]